MTGTGTELDPYVIYNVTDLENVNNNLTAWYILGNDIDCSSVNFYPIGTGSKSSPTVITEHPFTGHFNGMYHKIQNLSMNQDILDYGNIAIFALVRNAEIKNIIVENPIVTVTRSGPGSLSGYIGVFAGEINDSELNNIHITGAELHTYTNGSGFADSLWYSDSQEYIINKCSFKGDIYVNAIVPTTTEVQIGGFIHYIGTDNASILNVYCCYAEGIFVNQSGKGLLWSGGFCGSFESFSTSKLYINNCYSDFDLSTGIDTTGWDCGGFVGYADAFDSSYLEIKQCYSLGNVKTKESAGGFIGEADTYNSTCFVLIKDCYATGKATINYNYYPSIGCFAGNSWGTTGSSLIFQNCYGTGLVTNNGTGGVLGFLGSGSSYPYDNGDTICTDCFWDTQTSGASNSVCGTGKTTAQMKTQSTFTNWDFDKIWSKFVEGITYPLLQNKCRCILVAMGYL